MSGEVACARTVEIQHARQVVEEHPTGHHGCVFDSASPEDHRRDLAGPDIAAESWWTPERIALLGWLNNNAPALAPLYRGALALAMLGSFPGRVHFIAHAIREMRNRLPGALGPKVERRDAGYDHLANKIRKQWLAEGLPEDGRLLPSAGSEPSASGSLGRAVSYGFLASVGKLIEAHNEAQANREVRERHAFGALSDLGSNPSYVVTNWRRLTREAHKFAHAADEPPAAEADGEWVGKFFAFEQDMMAISRPSYENLDDLDRLLDEANRR